MRVLIFSASTGGGHMRASNALKNYITAHDESAIVEVIDTLEYVSHLLNKTVSDGYVFLAKKLPKLYGSVYNTANRDTTLNSLVTKITGQMTKKLIPLILEFRPDVIVTAHPFAAEMASNLKRDYRVPVEVVCIITDFAPHKTYINEKIDAYVVSSTEMVDAVEAYGVPREKIHALGIPIDTAFYERYDREALLGQMQLDPKLKTVLIMAGSFGVTDILKIYQSISEINVDFQVIVITGKNQKLYNAFEELLSSSKASAGEIIAQAEKGDDTESLDSDYAYHESMHSRLHQEISGSFKEKTGHLKDKIKAATEDFRDDLRESTLIQKLYRESGATKPTKLLYFVSDVNKYMSVADLIITKPGGLTVSESLASSLPMAIFKAFPGQEEENANFLVRNNMAVMLSKGSKCAREIEDLLIHPEKLDAMKRACKTFYKENSAENVYKLMCSLTDKDGVTQE